MSVETDEAPLRALVDDLSRARDAAARVAGRDPLGVRAVETSPGRRGYVVAFEGPAFLCLTGDLAPEDDPRRARETASAGLLWEHLETLVDADALRELAQAIGRALARDSEPREVSETLAVVATRALEAAAWRELPERALASLPAIDDAVALNERLVGAYARFVRASEPLAMAQDTLPPERVQALREVEEAAGRAGAAQRLAEGLAGAMPDCADGAAQMIAAHVTRLREDGGR